MAAPPAFRCSTCGEKFTNRRAADYHIEKSKRRHTVERIHSREEQVKKATTLGDF